MKKLVFRSGNEVEFTDASTISAMVAVVAKFADLDAIKAEFETADNLIGGTFDGNSIARVVYTGVSVSAGPSGNITATFKTRAFTHDEIVDSRLSDLEDAIAAI